MQFIAPDGRPREVPAALCDVGQLARDYVAGGKTRTARAIRVRRLLSLCGTHILGFGPVRLAHVFGVDEGLVRKDLERVLPELRAIAADSEAHSPDRLFIRGFHDGDGI